MASLNSTNMLCKIGHQLVAIGILHNVLNCDLRKIQNKNFCDSPV